MDTLAWFFFKLLVFEYIEEPGSGMAFRLPAGHCWKIFVEVLPMLLDCKIFTALINVLTYLCTLGTITHESCSRKCKAASKRDSKRNSNF